MGQDRRRTPPVVFVHGLGGSSRWWQRLRTEGRAVDVPRRLAPARAASWLASELHEPAVVVGHSLGGLVAATLAATAPERVAGLVLIAPVGVPRPLPRYAAGIVRETLRARWDVRRLVTLDALRTGPSSLALGAWFATQEVFVGQIEAPALLVWGERDRIVPPTLAETWRRTLPHARVATIPYARHVPMLDAPSAVDDLLTEFLRELSDEHGV